MPLSGATYRHYVFILMLYSELVVEEHDFKYVGEQSELISNQLSSTLHIHLAYQLGFYSNFIIINNNLLHFFVM